MAKKKYQKKEVKLYRMKVNLDAMPSAEVEKMWDALFTEIATTTKGIHRILNDNANYPTVTKFYGYLSADEKIQQRYARAKQIQAELLIGQIIEISDDSSQDIIGNEDEGYRFNQEFAQRSKLRVDSRKWLAAKLLPKVYGDKIDVTSNGETIKPIIGMEIK